MIGALFASGAEVGIAGALVGGVAAIRWLLVGEVVSG